MDISNVKNVIENAGKDEPNQAATSTLQAYYHFPEVINSLDHSRSDPRVLRLGNRRQLSNWYIEQGTDDKTERTNQLGESAAQSFQTQLKNLLTSKIKNGELEQGLQGW